MRVIGAMQLNITMTAAAAELTDMATGFSEVGDIVATASSRTAPRRTGALAQSMGHETGGKNTAVITSPLIYAGPIHWGRPSHNIRADPFVTDAAGATEDKQVGALERDAQRILNRVRGA